MTIILINQQFHLITPEPIKRLHEHLSTDCDEQFERFKIIKDEFFDAQRFARFRKFETDEDFDITSKDLLVLADYVCEIKHTVDDIGIVLRRLRIYAGVIWGCNISKDWKLEPVVQSPQAIVESVKLKGSLTATMGNFYRFANRKVMLDIAVIRREARRQRGEEEEEFVPFTDRGYIF